MYKIIGLNAWAHNGRFSLLNLIRFMAVTILSSSNRNSSLFVEGLVSDKRFNAPFPGDSNAFYTPTDSGSALNNRPTQRGNQINKLKELSHTISMFNHDQHMMAYLKLGLINPSLGDMGICFGLSKVFLQTKTERFLNEFISLFLMRQKQNMMFLLIS